MRIIGLDLSLTGTGVAVINPDVRGPHPEVSTIDPGKRAGHQRLDYILTELDEHLIDDAPAVVAIEGPSYGSKGSAYWQLAELHGLVKQRLYDGAVPYVLISPPSLKLYATGKGAGKGTDKDAVLLAVERRYGSVVKVANNNEADSLVLVAMAAHHYQVSTLPGVPQTHAAALAKVDWPDLGRTVSYG